jgi:hypothetical protein
MEAIRLASEITTTVLDAMSVDELVEFGDARLSHAGL